MQKKKKNAMIEQKLNTTFVRFLYVYVENSYITYMTHSDIFIS